MNHLKILPFPYTREEIETAKRKVYPLLLINTEQQLWLMYRKMDITELEKLGIMEAMRELNPSEAEEMDKLFYNLTEAIAC